LYEYIDVKRLNRDQLVSLVKTVNLRNLTIVLWRNILSVIK